MAKELSVADRPIAKAEVTVGRIAVPTSLLHPRDSGSAVSLGLTIALLVESSGVRAC